MTDQEAIKTLHEFRQMYADLDAGGEPKRVARDCAVLDHAIVAIKTLAKVREAVRESTSEVQLAVDLEEMLLP